MRRRKQRKANGMVGKVIGGIFAMILVMGAVVAGAAVYTAGTWVDDLPDTYDISPYATTGITKIYASDRSTVLASIRLVNRIEVDSDKIAQVAKDATVSVEDERFYTHAGYDLYGIARAAVSNITGGQEGASTITQQLVRNTVLLDEMNDISYQRKIREIFIAAKLEEQYSKDEILCYYLNVVNYGDGCYGIEAAARDYFGCHASELTLSQAAMLAGIPQSPNANNPRVDYERAMERRNHVLSRMFTNGYISQEEYDDARDDAPELAPEGSDAEDVADIAPYFVDYIKDLVSSGDFISDERAAQGGLNIYTTLDVACQNAANDAVHSVLDNFGDDAMDASLTSVDPGTGDIVAMVGGKDYENYKFNLSTQMNRQPGSCFKVFALLAAINEGVSPYNLYFDSSSPMTIGENWVVNNSGGTQMGQVNLQVATANSLNTVYAQLTHGIGPEKVVDMAHACGVKSKLNAVDSICLGTQGVNTLEMASAYATIASGGIYREPIAIAEISDEQGNVLYVREYDDGQRVISPEVAHAATMVMETVITQGTGTGARLDNGQVAAGKTGTSEHGRDLWFCGFTPQYSAAVWTGYREEAETPYYGNTSSTPIWQRYMSAVCADKEIEAFPDAGDPSYKNNWSFGTTKKEETKKDTKTDEDEEKKKKEAEEAAKKEKAESDSSKSDSSGSSSSNSNSNSGSSNSNSGGKSNSGGNSNSSSNGNSTPSTPATPPETPSTPTTPTTPTDNTPSTPSDGGGEKSDSGNTDKAKSE